MELTQIQGQNVGATIPVPPGQEVPLPVIPGAPEAPQGYIQNTADGQKTIVPHANIPVAVNGQVIKQPTPLQHGDTVSINHGAASPTVLAVRAPGQKLQASHVGEYVRKAGMNLNEAQILALVEEIENVEKQKYLKIVFGVFGGIVLAFLAIGFVWFSLGDKVSLTDLATTTKKVTTLQKELATISETLKKANGAESSDKITELQGKIEELDKKLTDSGASLDTATKQQIADIVSQLTTQAETLKTVSGLADQVQELESIVKASELGKVGTTMKYYEDLKVQCGTNECCLNSLNTMIQNSYKIAESGTCPVGQEVNRLKCLDSLLWCIPSTNMNGSTTTSSSTSSSGGLTPVTSMGNPLEQNTTTTTSTSSSGTPSQTPSSSTPATPTTPTNTTPSPTPGM